MPRHRKRNYRETKVVFGPLTINELPEDTQETHQTRTPKTPEHYDGVTFFLRVREAQKKASEAASQRAAAEKAEAERLTLLHRKSGLLNQFHSEESDYLMYKEAAERDVLQQKMAKENPETIRVVQALVQEKLDQAMRADMQRKAEKSLVRTHEMLFRNDIADKEIKEHLSIWAKFQKTPVPTAQQRIAERNKNAAAELRRRNEAAQQQRVAKSHLFPSTPKKTTSPTFDMVENDGVQQSTTPKPTRWW